MISKGRTPGPDETGPNRDHSAEINAYIDNFSFVGLSPDGSTRIVSVRTSREPLFMSSADDGPDNVHFNAGIRVVRVDPVQDCALVSDVVHPPARGREGLLRSYVVNGFTSSEPYVSWTGDDTFEPRSAFDFNLPEGGYIKIYHPLAAGSWDGAEAARLMRSGEMDTAQWHEFSVAHKVEIALQVHNAHLPE